MGEIIAIFQKTNFIANSLKSINIMVIISKKSKMMQCEEEEEGYMKDNEQEQEDLED